MPASKTTNSQAKRHLREAYINYRRYQRFLDEPENLQWAIVLLFYAAVHLVDAYARDKHPDVKFKSHEQRDSYVANELKVISRVYGRLKSASQDARYELIQYDRSRTLKFHDECFHLVRIELKTRGFEWELPAT